MSRNLRSILTKEKVKHFIEEVKSSKGSFEENIDLKHHFSLQIRNELQSYNPSLSENQSLKCFINAANVKYDTSNNDIYYIETARSTFIGAIMGGFLCGSVPTVLCNLFEFDHLTLKFIFGIGAIIGGSLGFYAGLDFARNEIEQESSWNEVIKCVHGNSPMELSGALYAEDMI